jgi:hypothetical protein
MEVPDGNRKHEACCRRSHPIDRLNLAGGRSRESQEPVAVAETYIMPTRNRVEGAIAV